MDIVRFVEQTALSISDGTGLDLEITLPPDPCHVKMDPKQFFQVFDNIITNSKEAMPNGGRLKICVGRVNPVALETTFLPLLPGRQYIGITIEDQGPGIPMADIDNAFDPYFSTKKRGVVKGMGLGLTVVHAVVEKHGGCTTITPGKDGGTAVSLFLPILGISLTGCNESNRDITTSA